MHEVNPGTTIAPTTIGLIHLSIYCNGTMQHRIEEHPDFESMIQNDPIELLKAIKILLCMTPSG